MRHARADYNRIQDPAGIIPADEPVFLIRGQDIAAVPTIRAYAVFAERAGADASFANRVRMWAHEIEIWQSQRGLKVKVPDLPLCPECKTGILLAPIDGKRVCDQCGLSEKVASGK